jgi:aconitase A
MVDEFGTADAFNRNVELEYERNIERYNFLKWGQQAFNNFPRRAARHRHLPPGQPGDTSPRPSGP